MSMGICHYYLIVFFLILTFIKVSNANHLIPLRPSSSGNRYENIGGFIFSNTGHKNGDQHDRRIAERRNLQSWIDSIYENDRKSYTNYQTQYNSKRSNSPLMESSLDERKVGRIFESILEGLANGSLYLPKTDLGSGVREFFRTLQYVKKSSRETNLQTGEKVSQKVSRKRGPLSLGPIEKKRLKGQGFGTNGDLGLKNGKKLDDVDEDGKNMDIN